MVWFYLEHTVSGRAGLAIGVNRGRRLAGIDVGRHLIFAYVVCGVLAAMAGCAARLAARHRPAERGRRLRARRHRGGGDRRGVLGGGGGTALGALGRRPALAVVDNVLNLFNVDSYYQQVVKGLIILVAVLARRKKA